MLGEVSEVIASDLSGPIADVDGQADRAPLVRDSAANVWPAGSSRSRRWRSGAPGPGRTSRQPGSGRRSLLDQVLEGEAEAPVALGDAHHEPQVLLDKRPPRPGVLPARRAGQAPLPVLILS